MKTIIALGIATFILIVAPISIIVLGLHYTTAQGEHVGYITAVEKVGVFFKTYRAYVKTDTQSSQEDSYCVVDESLVPALEAAASSHIRVTVGYMSYFSPGIRICDGEDAIIESITR